jgi:hypothetical protein
LIEILQKELAVHGISFEEGQVSYRGKPSSVGEIQKNLDDRLAKNKKFLHRICREFYDELKNPTAGDADKQTRRMFVHAIKSVYSIFSESKCPIPLVRAAYDIVNSDSGLFSAKFMSKVIDFHLGLQWLIHLIRRDHYTRHLVGKYLKLIARKRVSMARGFGGPWGRLDLPMEERVFEWSDVAEETAGRTGDKQRQRRYRMGLENTSDNWPNEGFYWREIRNEPFLWGDEDENPYPHRNVLWSS